MTFDLSHCSLPTFLFYTITTPLFFGVMFSRIISIEIQQEGSELQCSTFQIKTFHITINNIINICI